MIHDNAPLRVFKISELTRAIASQLVPISRKSVANLACACRCLEEPVLSTLWETQESLSILLEVLPEANLQVDGTVGSYTVRGLDLPVGGIKCSSLGSSQFEVVGDPSPEVWNRVQRYASWMYRVCLDESWALEEDAFSKFRHNSPAGGWFPALRELDWCATRSNLPCVNVFLSPHLKKISIRLPPPWYGFGVPSDALPAIASIIFALPTSALQSLKVFSLTPWNYKTPRAAFRDSLSSAVLGCGPSLTEFISIVPLSETAVEHLIRLPHLHTCRIEGPPPSHPASHLPLVFPPLAELALGKDTPGGWLSVLERLGGCPAPLSKVKESLKSLKLPSTTTDTSFVSLAQIFHNLVNLWIDADCDGRGDGPRCIFKLNNDNVTELAVALPQLELLVLGRPCSNNTCTTTVACLLSISVHCVKLRTLVIHFNTTNIVNDLKGISGDPRFHELRSRPKCKLPLLHVHQMPLTLDEADLETAVNGMVVIFPSLRYCTEVVWCSHWEGLSEELWKFQDAMDPTRPRKWE